MVGIQTAAGSHRRVVDITLLDKHFCVFAGLNAFQGIAHGFFAGSIDHFRAGNVFAVLRIVGNGVVHIGNTAFENQVNNQFHFVQTFEVSHFRRVTGFGQGFKTRLDQLDHAAAQYGLFAKQIGFGFFAESGFNHTAFGAAVGSRIRQGDVFGFAGIVLVNGNQRRHAAAAFVFTAYGMTRTFGSNHNHVQVGTRNDLVVVHVEAVCKCQRCAFFQIGCNFGVIDGRHGFVRQQQHNDIGFFGRFSNGFDDMAGCFGFFPRRAVAQTDHHVYTRIFQVGGMGMTLRTVTDDGNGFAFDQGQIGIFIVIDLHLISFKVNGCRSLKMLSGFGRVKQSVPLNRQLHSSIRFPTLRFCRRRTGRRLGNARWRYVRQ
ncbi:Uncharacterised protein [Neisseria meningitidis]|nr:Uncharacterised protein [Neisseria meningitidis]CWS72946.1 Uncharacterised protein [Neisseria meningitidis]